MKFTSTNKENKELCSSLLSVSIDWSEIEPLKKPAITNIGKHISMDGFRAGHVPEAMLLKKIPTSHLLSEMADMAIQSIYVDLIKEHNITPIGKPVITLKKLVEGNTFEFTIESDTLPVVTLPKTLEKDAKKFLSPKISNRVLKKDIEDALIELQKMRIQHETKEIPEVLPPLDDEFAKGLGKFTTLDEVRAALKENIEHEKIHHEIDKRHGEFYDHLVESCNFAIPQSMINFEIDKRIAQLEHDTSMAGHTLEDYLLSIQKTKEQIIEDIRPNAEKSAKLELIFNEIATINNIVPDQKNVDLEVQASANRYKDSKDFDIDRARDYFFTVHKNRAVIAFLDKLGDLPHIHAEEHTEVEE